MFDISITVKWYYSSFVFDVMLHVMECPENYCHTPSVGVGVRVHKNFNFAYNLLPNTDWAFIFNM